MRIENRLQLQLWREECKEKHQKEKCRILVCGGTGCLAGGSDKIYARFKEMSEGMDHVTVQNRRRDCTSGSKDEWVSWIL